MAIYLDRPYPDELLLSVICRYIARLKVTARQRFIRCLFGYFPAFSPLNIPLLEILAREVSAVWGWSPEEIAENLTTYPYYAAFLDARDRETLVQGHDATKRGLSTYTIRTWPGSHLRVCRECFREDRLAGREQYWRRTHQLPGVILCVRHGTMLCAINTRQFPRRTWLTHEELRDYEMDLSVRLSIEQRRHCMAVAEVSDWLLSNKVDLKKKELLPLWLRITSQVEFGRTSSVWRDIKNAFIEFFGRDYVKLFLMLSAVQICNSHLREVTHRKHGSTLHILLFGIFFAGCAEKMRRATWPACPGTLLPRSQSDTYGQEFNRLVQATPCVCGFCVTNLF